MATIGSREFQVGYQKLTEVTRVEARGKYLGTWYPAGSEPMPAEDQVNEIVNYALEEQTKEVEALQAEVKQLKRLLAERDVASTAKISAGIKPADDQGFGRSYAVPKPGKRTK